MFLVTTPEPVYFIDDHCANCLAPLTDDIIGLRCSTWCADINQRVRYCRRVERDGRIADPLIQAQVQMNLTFLLIGGYRALGRRPSAATRMMVVSARGRALPKLRETRDRPDHIDGSSDEPANLQLLCKDCHRQSRCAQSDAYEPALDIQFAKREARRS